MYSDLQYYIEDVIENQGKLLINGKPPAMPGDSQSLTFSEVARQALLGHRGRNLKRETKNGRHVFWNRQSCQKGAYRMKMFDSLAHTTRICKIYLTQISKYREKWSSKKREKQSFEALRKKFVGEFSLSFGRFNQVIGMDEETIRQYIKNHGNEDIHVEQLSLANMQRMASPPLGG